MNIQIECRVHNYDVKSHNKFVMNYVKSDVTCACKKKVVPYHQTHYFSWCEGCLTRLCGSSVALVLESAAVFFIHKSRLSMASFRVGKVLSCYSCAAHMHMAMRGNTKFPVQLGCVRLLAN